MTERRDGDGGETDLVAEQGNRARPDRCAEGGVDRRERRADDVECGRARDPATADEATLDPRLLELGRDLRPRPVDDADPVRAREREHELGRVRGDRAAELDDDDTHVR
jgi:hypothetical protein